MPNSLGQMPAVKFHTYQHTSGALSAWKIRLDILHMLQHFTLTLKLYTSLRRGVIPGLLSVWRCHDFRERAKFSHPH